MTMTLLPSPRKADDVKSLRVLKMEITVSVASSFASNVDSKSCIAPMLLSHLSGTATHTPVQLKFHEAMWSYGGRLPLELLPATSEALPAVYQLGHALISRANKVHPRLPRIHFDFVNSNEINGV